MFAEFLACVHLHTDEGDLAEISKTKTIRMVPLLCGLASRCRETIETNSINICINAIHMFRDKSESQRIVSKVVKNLGTEEAEYKNTDEYLRHLQALYLGE